AALPTAAAPSVEVHFSVPMRATLAVSPDGARIAVGSAERLVVHDVDSDRLIPFARQGERTIGYLEFVDADHLAMVRVGAAPEVETWDLVADRVVTARSLPPRTRWFGSVRDGDLLMRAAADGSELVVGDLDHQRRLALMRRPIEILAIAPTRDRIAFVESSAYGGRLVVIDVASGATVRGDDIVELTGVTWHDADHLWITTGTTVDPAILEVDVAADHLGAPRRIYHQERGWFGSIVTAAGRTFFVNSANTFRAKLVTRGGAVQDVDPELFGAGLAWLDDTRWLAWNRTTGELAPSDDGAADRVAAAIDGEPGNATRAGDLVIVAMRKPGGRELVAVSLGDARRRWTLPVGTAALVRCAGDARPPCVAVVQPEDDDARVVRIDLATGALGDEITRARVIQDVAVSPDGAEVLVCDGSPAIRAVALATGATRGSYRVPMSVTRGITYDPAGGFLVAGTKPPVSYQILRIDGDRQDVLAQSDTEILFMPRPSPAGDRVLVMGRLFMPKLYELR
ncbi:MAG: hypothetical protein KC464_24675, partial [Myxococcales bacterium]|nr:hypothetical protein [Myxococcales bacterium]